MEIILIYIYIKLTGRNVVYTLPYNCEFVGIGSILDHFVKNSNKILKIIKYRYLKPIVSVWGAGFIEQHDKGNIFFRRMDFKAVRGYKTLERIKKLKPYHIDSDIAIGDPGLLCSKIYNKQTEKKYHIGVVPHYSDKNHELLKNIHIKDCKFIDIQSDTEDFIDQVRECEFILSSSLHGLIAADSYNIPNARLIVSNKLIGGEYKFQDYYSAYGITDHNKINLKETVITQQTINNLIENYSISPKQVDTICQNLLKKFPLPIDDKSSLYGC